MSIIERLLQHRGWLVGVAAVGLGAVAAFAARSYLDEQLAIERDRLAPRQDLVEVVVAKSDLQRGDVLGPDTMAVRAMPREYLPGAVVFPSQFETWSGRRLARPMRGGEPLVQSSIDGIEAGALSSRVRAGIRALTIPVDESNSIAGLLRPGDRIDLLLSAKQPSSGAPGSEVTVTLMQDVPVLATGRTQRAVDDNTGAGRAFNSITVEVDPVQAQRLLVAQRAGKLTVALRHPDDRREVPARAMDVAQLFGAAPVPVPTRAGPELIVGGRGALHGQSDRTAQAHATPSMLGPLLGAISALPNGSAAPPAADPLSDSRAGPSVRPRSAQ